jgi:hypothetical protein
MNQTPLPTREEMTGMLKDGIVEVTFTKKDGSERVMKATLNADYMPESRQDIEDAKPRPESSNPDLINCFDVEAGGWRCFKLSSLVAQPIPVKASESDCEGQGCEDCQCGIEAQYNDR